MTAVPSHQSHPFHGVDWLLILSVGLMWGASFLFIKIAVVDVEPVTVAWLRLACGAAFLFALPAARQPLVDRREWWLVITLGIVWMAFPFVLFPIAEETIDSGMAGMINGSAPLFTAVIAALWFHIRPRGNTLLGLLIGFVGVAIVTLPSAGNSIHGVSVGLLLLATVLYGVAFNLSGPLEERNGALPVIFRSQVVALVVTTPMGITGLFSSTPTAEALASIALLGVISTGLAFACFVTLVGRVGPPRASIAVYFVPVTSILLGVTLGNETPHVLSVLGIIPILLGAYLTSRSSARNASPDESNPTAPTATPQPGDER